MRNLITMSKKNFFTATAALLAAAAALALAGCSSDDEIVNSNYPEDNIVRLTAGVNDMTTRGTYTNSNLKEFGIYIVHPNNYKYSFGNVKATKGEDGKWTTSEQMLWADASTPVAILAYAPYNADYTKDADRFLDDFFDENIPQALRFKIPTEQTADDKSADILLFNNSKFVPGNDLESQAVNVTFDHALSQLNINIKIGTEFDLPNKLESNPVSNVKVGRVPIDGDIAVKGGRVSVDQTNNSDKYVSPYLSQFTAATGNAGREVSNATSTYTCILVPTTRDENTFQVTFSMTINGVTKNYSWTSPDRVTFVSGKSYSLTLTVGDDYVVAGNMTVTPWTEGGSTDLNTD